MDPIHLNAILKGQLDRQKLEESVPKSRLEDELIKESDSYVDEIVNEEHIDQQKLQDRRLKREKMKLESREELKLPEATEQVDLAITLLLSEGMHYHSNETHQELISDLSNATKSLSDISFKETDSSNLQTLSKISDDSIKAIIDMAREKFNKENYIDSLALFSFLSFLNPAYSEYWFRMGVAAQKCDKIELASRAYAATLALDPNNIGAKLFAAECFVKLKRLDEAKALVEQTKNITRDVEVDQMWLELIPIIESMIFDEDRSKFN